MRDRVAFRSARLPTEHFDARFASENLAFWVPLLVECGQVRERFIAAMAAADAQRVPLGMIEALAAGCRVSQLLVEARSRCAFVTAAELNAGLRVTHADAEANGANWVDPRPTSFIAASKTSSTTPSG